MLLQDDLGHNDVGFNGNEGERGLATSNISALARDGIILSHHYVHWHCSPTRRSFLSGRLPVHHHEQLSGIDTDDIDLRYTWISKKLESAGYKNYWFGKGHTGYKSMAHLPTRNGFHHFMGFLSGSQSYFSTDRWEDEHPVHQDSQFVNPPAGCGENSSSEWAAAHFPSWSSRTVDSGTDTCPKNQTGSKRLDNVAFKASGNMTQVEANDADDCCFACHSAACSHWTWQNSTGKTVCSMWYGSAQRVSTPGAISAVAFHPTKPTPAPGPPTPPPGPKTCAASYSTTLYGELCLQALAAHDPKTPFFLYFAIQAVHTPYDKPPGYIGDAYTGMLEDTDRYINLIVKLMKQRKMYENSVIVYSAGDMQILTCSVICMQ
jgi:arylsulfatase A-like enzyme